MKMNYRYIVIFFQLCRPFLILWRCQWGNASCPGPKVPHWTADCYIIGWIPVQPAYLCQKYVSSNYSCDGLYRARGIRIVKCHDWPLLCVEWHSENLYKNALLMISNVLWAEAWYNNLIMQQFYMISRWCFFTYKVYWAGVFVRWWPV